MDILHNMDLKLKYKKKAPRHTTVVVCGGSNIYAAKLVTFQLEVALPQFLPELASGNNFHDLLLMGKWDHGKNVNSRSNILVYESSDFSKNAGLRCFREARDWF